MVDRTRLLHYYRTRFHPMLQYGMHIIMRAFPAPLGRLFASCVAPVHDSLCSSEQLYI